MAAERKTSDNRRREIADAALRVIAEQGLGRFTALAIAREVGVSDAALFQRFGTIGDRPRRHRPGGRNPLPASRRRGATRSIDSAASSTSGSR